MLKLENVTLKKHQQMILDDICLNVGKGTITTIIGEEGAGKTKLCEVIANHLSITSGVITINDLKEETYSHNAIGAFIEPCVINENEKVITLLKERCAYMHIKKEKTHIKELSDLLGLTPYLKVRVKTLSSSYKQLVKLALAFASYPELVVLDDPFAHLDAKQIKRVKQLLVDCIAVDMSFILTMRDDIHVSDLPTQMYYMAQGHLTHHQVDLSPQVLLALNTTHQDEAIVALKDYHPRIMKGMILFDIYDDEQAFAINTKLVGAHIPFDELTFINASYVHAMGGVHRENSQH